jgi:L-alanine-DL-glutamate epimerase-like enolase superfamily enzyme
VHRAIGDTIAPFLEGRVLADPDALRVLFVQGPGADTDLAKIYCAVEIALYDLAGQARGVPVSELLGGRVRDSIRLYGSAGMYMSPEAYAAEAAAIAGLGFRAYKMRPAAGPEQDLETVRLMRKAVGPDFDLMVDAHTWWRMGDRSYSPSTVEQLAQDMAAHRIAWLEEPLPPDDHAAYLALKEKDLVPLASGEHEPNEERFLDLILTQAVDYVQMDVCCQGGYSLGRRLFAEIARQGLRFAFHSWGTALEVAAAAHLGICWPQMVVEWLEYPCYSTPGNAGMYPFPLAAEILTQPLEIERGELMVPRTPGLGVKVDERVIERYPWIPGPWSLFRTDSPAETRAVTSDHSVQWDAGAR